MSFNPIEKILGKKLTNDKLSLNNERKYPDVGYDREPQDKSDTGGPRCEDCGKLLNKYNTSIYAGLCTTCYGKHQ